MWAPASFHLDLYRYWLAKRKDRIMPARGDLEPGDIRLLLPYLTIVDKVDDRPRYRLVGSAVAQQLGRDMTGRFVGSYVAAPSADVLRAVSERVFATGHRVFAIAEFKTESGAVHTMSQLLLPLSDDGAEVNMTVSTRVARYKRDVRAASDWLKEAPLKITTAVNVDQIAELEKLCLDWERRCFEDEMLRSAS
ncbi:MAG: PAS domain-containing protein [Rhodomicrobium sp.]